MPTALLTGANGFLGGHILAVVKESYNVETLGKNPGNHLITDLSSGQVNLSHSYDLVVHAAGKAHTKNEKEAALFYAVNTEGSRRICEAFDSLGIYPKQFVFISTVAVYGLVKGENIREDHPLNGTTAYARSKIEAEKIIETWCNAHNITCTILRLPLVAGSNAPGNIRAMVNAIAKNRFFLTGNGEARKSMVLATDVAEFILPAASSGGIYNLAGADHPSMKEFAFTIAAQSGKRPPICLPLWICKLLAKAGDLLGKKFPFNSSVLTQLNSTLTFSDEKARNLIGWKPRSVLDNYTV